MEISIFRNKHFLLIDDDSIHLDILKSKVISLGITNFKLAGSFEEGMISLSQYSPDVILGDFYLDNSKTILDVLSNSKISADCTTIVVSAFYDNETLNKLSNFRVMDLLHKNMSSFELEKSIRMNVGETEKAFTERKLKSAIFVKSGRNIVKINVSDIQYIEVDGKYLELITDKKKYIIRNSLNAFIQKLPENFVKVSQSSAINIDFLETINTEDNIINMPQKQLPFSRNFKKSLLNMYYLS